MVCLSQRNQVQFLEHPSLHHDLRQVRVHHGEVQGEYPRGGQRPGGDRRGQEDCSGYIRVPEN